MNIIYFVFYKKFLLKYIYFCILLILSGIIGQNNKIYTKKIKYIIRIIITRCKYFAQINYYKHCSATAHLPPSSLASLQSWGHVGNVSWITLECIFSSRFVHKLFLFFAPGKKRIFFIFGKDYLDKN